MLEETVHGDKEARVWAKVASYLVRDLIFTRYVFVESGIVHESINTISLALDTSYIALLCMLQSILGNEG